jgi:hypothetical protein
MRKIKESIMFGYYFDIIIVVSKSVVSHREELIQCIEESR